MRDLRRLFFRLFFALNLVDGCEAQSCAAWTLCMCVVCGTRPIDLVALFSGVKLSCELVSTGDEEYLGSLKGDLIQLSELEHDPSQPPGSGSCRHEVLQIVGGKQGACVVHVSSNASLPFEQVAVLHSPGRLGPNLFQKIDGCQGLKMVP